MITSTLLLLFTFAIGNVWAADPDYESYDWNSSDAMTAGLAGNTSVSISVVTSGSDGNVSGHYYKALNSAIDGSNASLGTRLSISSASQIDSVEIFFCPNGTNNTNLAWAGWGESVTPSAEVGANYGTTASVKSSKAWASAVWQKIDLSDKGIYTLYISRQGKKLTNGGASISNFGDNQTVNLLGIRVWLHKYTVTINPDGGSTSTEGWTLSEGKYLKYVASSTSVTLPTMSKGGNTFAGWKNKNNEDVTSPITITKDTVLTAQWTPSGGTTHNITYNNTKGATNSNPATYYEGTGIASFAALADVTDFHFNGWSPASIAADATTDQTISATWVDAYNVTFALGTGASGTAPAGFQKWEGAKFNLPGQGDMVAPSGKVFDGWKVSGTKYAANAEYTMGNAAVEFVAQWKNAPTVLFHYNMGNIDAPPADNTENSATGGKILFRNAKMGKESSSFNAAVKGDMIGGANSLKLGGNADSIRINLTTGNFQEGDTIYITGYNPFVISTTIARNGDVATSVTTGTAKTDYNLGYCVIPAGIDTKYLYIGRESSSCGFAAIKVIRPAAREIASTVITLSDVKVNGRSISSDSLAILKTASAYALTLKDAFASAPEIKFNEHTVITYADGESPATKETDKVYTVTATEVSSQWQAQQTIDGITYTVNAPKVSSATVTYYDGATKLGEEVVAVGGYATASEITTTREHYTFDGWYNDAGLSDGPVTLASTVINADKDFYGSWTENAKAAVTFQVDGAQYGDVQNVYVGDKVASVDSPTKAGNVFQGWYNGESKFDFTAAIASGTAITLDAKWAAADANHYVYAYNDDFHYDGVVYKTPEGKVDAGTGNSNIALTNTAYTLFSGAEGITSVVVNNGIYDSKTGATQAVTALMKVNTTATSNLTVTIKSGYTAVMKVKMGSWDVSSAAPTVTFKKGDDEISYTGTMSGKASDQSYAELTYNLTAGTYIMTTATKTLYFSNIDIEATALTAYTVTYKPGEGTGSDVVDDEATQVNDCPNTFTAPEGKIFNGWKDALDADVAVGAIVEGDMTLTAQWINHYAVTFNMNDHGSAILAQDIKHGSKATEPDDPFEIGYDFGGWFTDNGTFENQFDFNTAITAATPLYAKWTAFNGCVLLYPATSGSALSVGDNVDVQTGSFGANIAVVGMKTAGSSIAYDARGLLMGGGSADVISVTLNNDMAIDTKISVTLDAKAGSRARGLYLLNGTGGSVKGGTLLGWDTPGDDVAEGEIETFSYTVEDADGLAGTNVFRLKRQNSTYIKCIKVESCGAAITYHNLTSEVNIAGKGTVTLGASSVREGYTTTAEYSEIDPLYEFVNWTVSGAGASVADATANPATITVGTEDAVVTLNLQLKPVYYTVTYYDGASEMGTESVAENGHPTATGITTKKLGYTFDGWSETDGGAVVALDGLTITGDKNLYAKYTAIACPTSGTVYKFDIKDELPSENLPTSTDKDMSSYITATGDGYLTYTATANNKATINSDGTIQMKDASAAYLKVELECALAAGDQIRAHVTNNPIRVQVGKTYDSNKDLILAKNAYEFVAITSAMEGKQVLYITRSSNGNANLADFEIYRPAKFDVSFNMMGHGTQIADIEDVIEGSKITAPTAPTDEDYSFAGWYKENTLANEWKFDADVVEANTTLYAKWLDKSDATLKSLKYGETEIALEAGVYTYNVTLPAFTSAVPALTAETSNPSATKVIANAAAFDSEGNATSTVTVTPEVGADQVYTVNFAKGVEILLQDVTGSITWNFANAVTANVSITGTPQVLANYGGVTNDNTFESDKLEASGEKFTAGSNANLRANYIRFHTTVPGILSISYSNTGGSNPARYIYVNGVKYDEEGSASTTKKGLDTKVFVPAGDVELVMKDGEDASKNVQIYQMIFNATPDYTRDVTEGRYGTICLPNGGVMVGAALYEVAYYGETSQKIFFDEILGGTMVAGVPYIFLPKEGATQLGVFYTDEANAPAGSHNGLIGFIGADATAETAVPDGEGCYILQNNQYREVLAGANARIKSNRAYIKLSNIGRTEPALSPGRKRISFSIEGSQVATGMENINADETPKKVMINGELFILRGEKMYNVNGQIVK